MFVVKDNTHVMAPIERVFLLSTSLALVERELGMRPVRGEGLRSEGLVVAGDRVRWEGWKFGMPQVHVSLISEYDPPRYFQDRMIAGRFRTFQHDHEFTEIGGQVLMKETVRFSLPLGWVGRMVGKNILVPHIRGVIHRRFALLKRIAESEEWRDFL